MRKKYILDTSALITDPYCYNHFPDADVIIPIVVLNELDNLKQQFGEAGKNARVCIKLLDELTSNIKFDKQITLENNSTLEINIDYLDVLNEKFSYLGDLKYGDNQILACAIFIAQKNPTSETTLVSNDVNLRVRARAKGLLSQKHDKDAHNLNDLFTGVQIILDENAGEELKDYHSLDPSIFDLELHPNECVIFQTKNKSTISLGRRIHFNRIKAIKNHTPWGINAKNDEQSLAIDLMMDKTIDLITLVGKAGTGKSLIALACAMELVLNRKQYEKLIVYRPIESVGKEIGYLPGELSEKMAPWFQAILDNFEVLLSSKNKKHEKDRYDWQKDLEMFQKKGLIELGAMTYIRGRSIPNSIILIDEVQNISKEDIKTLLTRAGENTKVILTGDICQIDNKSLDTINNGLTYVIEKFKTSELAGHITFTKGERSRLATKASEIL